MYDLETPTASVMSFVGTYLILSPKTYTINPKPSSSVMSFVGTCLTSGATAWRISYTQ